MTTPRPSPDMGGSNVEPPKVEPPKTREESDDPLTKVLDDLADVDAALEDADREEE